MSGMEGEWDGGWIVGRRGSWAVRSHFDSRLGRPSDALVQPRRRGFGWLFGHPPSAGFAAGRASVRVVRQSDVPSASAELLPAPLT